MAYIETLNLPHLPGALRIHVSLFRELQNAAFFQEQLLSGNPEFEYAFIDASMVLSREHILAAVFRAVNDYLKGRLKSRNVHSEIVFCLSPNNNITESFRKFGLTNATKNLLAVKVSTAPGITHDSVTEHLGKVVKASPVPFDDGTLATMSDVDKIRKVYKVGSTPAGFATNAPKHLTRSFDRSKQYLQVCILSAIALRGAS